MCLHETRVLVPGELCLDHMCCESWDGLKIPYTPGSNELTISMWIKVPQEFPETGDCHIVDWGDEKEQEIFPSIFMMAGRRISFQMTDKYQIVLEQPHIPLADDWFHVAMVIRTQEFTVHVGGAMIGMREHDLELLPSKTFHVGLQMGKSSFAGVAIRDLNVTNCALSEESITHELMPIETKVLVPGKLKLNQLDEHEWDGSEIPFIDGSHQFSVSVSINIHEPSDRHRNIFCWGNVHQPSNVAHSPYLIIVSKTYENAETPLRWHMDRLSGMISNDEFTFGVPFHFVLVVDGKKVEVFIDGRKVGGGTSSNYLDFSPHTKFTLAKSFHPDAYVAEKIDIRNLAVVNAAVDPQFISKGEISPAVSREIKSLHVEIASLRERMATRDSQAQMLLEVRRQMEGMKKDLQTQIEALRQKQMMYWADAIFTEFSPRKVSPEHLHVISGSSWTSEFGNVRYARCVFEGRGHVILRGVTENERHDTTKMKAISDWAFNFSTHPCLQSVIGFVDEVSLIEGLDTEMKDHCPDLIMVLDSMDDENDMTLREYLNHFGPDGLSRRETLAIMTPVCEGVAFLHDIMRSLGTLSSDMIRISRRKSVAHLDELKVCISEVGMKKGREIPQDDRVRYFPPEMLLGEERQDPFAADVWSIGMVFIEAITGKRPFDNRSRDGAIAAIGRKNIDEFVRAVETSECSDLKDIVVGCLCVDATDRRPVAKSIWTKLKQLRT
eukprot:TRINITY_DN5228_c0_g2_i4.p1 TRINITY_DN5228_c0_g2~~TRINITY_DN5228_c0_g2_i4.p1  ORF type:complete len:723 (-),score=176.20 TRINITY_DN5228_c0_g2_i4:1990-4158(-)